jgi:shikimate dehydrogenase
MTDIFISDDNYNDGMLSTLTGQAKIAGVMGWPVSHSLSPRLHGYWLHKYSMDGMYVPFPVNPETLEKALRALPLLGIAGCNLTVPHKELAFRMVDRLDETAKSVKAVNTLIVEKDGTLTGKNTDVFGFIQNLKDHLPDLKPVTGKVVVLGAGGASRAVITGLLAEGARQIVLANRNLEKAEQLAEDFASPYISVVKWEARSRVLEGADLLVNTTTLGMKGQSELEISLDALPKSATVTDIVYHPLMTGLLQQAKQRGNMIIDGIGMLLHQAAPGFEAWFGLRPQVDKRLKSYVLQGLEA